MSKKIEGSFINFALVKDIKRAKKAGVVEADYIDTDKEQCHISELERELIAFDSEEIYVAIKSFIRHHKQTLIKIFDYLDKEEQEQEGDIEK